MQIFDAAQAGGLVVAEPDLVRHLVITHHGFGRPFCPASTEGTAMATIIDCEGHTTRTPTNPTIEDWAQPERFRDLE